MSDELATAEIERLERIVSSDPAAPAFPALAEAHRRAGEAKRAEQVARAGLVERPDHVAGGVALALALIDQERSDEARGVLEHALDVTPEHVLARRALDELGSSPSSEPGLDGFDSELDAAFDEARPDSEVMLDAHDLAHEAVRRVDVGAEDPVDFVADSDSPFATRTVADLLERQGDTAGAQAVRRSLAGGEEGADQEQRRRVIETLEGWILKLRRSESS